MILCVLHRESCFAPYFYPFIFDNMLSYEDSKSPSQFSTNVLEWDDDKVSRWIAHMGLSKYSSNFQGKLNILTSYYITNWPIENNITGDVLVHLNQTDLSEIGVSSVGHRLRILKAIYNIIIAQDLNIDSDHYVPPSMYSSCFISDYY